MKTQLQPHEIRFAGRPKKYRNPRQEKMMDFRHQHRTRYDKENKYARKIWNQMNRALANQAIRTADDYEDIDIVYLKKTQGWITH